MLLYAKEADKILAWEGSLMQIPFVRNMKIRAGYPDFGHPFLGPDGGVMTLSDRVLRGSRGNHQLSMLIVP